MAGELMQVAEKAAQSRTLKGAWHAKALLKILAELAQRDHSVERRKRHAKYVQIAGTVGAILSFIVSLILLGTAEMWELGASGSAILVFIGVIVAGVKMKKAASQIDIADDVRLTIAPLVRQLADDLHPAQKIRVSLDLRALDGDSDKPIRSQTKQGGKRGTTEIAYFAENLGHLRLALANGDVVIVGLKNGYKRAVRSYHGSSGKSKKKTKWKKTSRLRGTLIPANPKPWELRAMKAFLTKDKDIAVRFKDVNGVTTARMERRLRFQKLGDPPPDMIPVGEVLSLLVRLVAMGRHGIQGASL